MNKQLKTLWQGLEKLKKAIYTLWKSLFVSQKQDSSVSAPSVILEVRHCMFEGLSLIALNNYERQLLCLGCQVQVKELSKEIPNGYVGVESCWHGEKLEFQRYLKIQEEYVCKKLLLSQLIDLGAQPIVLADSDYMNFPPYYLQF